MFVFQYPNISDKVCVWGRAAQVLSQVAFSKANTRRNASYEWGGLWTKQALPHLFSTPLYVHHLHTPVSLFCTCKVQFHPLPQYIPKNTSLFSYHTYVHSPPLKFLSIPRTPLPISVNDSSVRPWGTATGGLWCSALSQSLPASSSRTFGPQTW